MSRSQRTIAVALWLLSAVAVSHAAAADNAWAVLVQNSQQGKYTFLCFYREDNQATRAMAQMLKSHLAEYADRASLCFVSVADPAQQDVVKRFGVSRAPLPFAVAVAPNGAMTALLSQKATPQQIASAFLTPGAADCMKAMQDRKLVLVCVQAAGQQTLPAAVEDFQSDPEFMDRVRVVAVRANDPNEAAFLQQMEVDGKSVKGSTIVFMAPPAVLVGKFSQHATKAEMAAALHAAGKCCDDPNCKHNHAPQAAKSGKAARK
jgi:hypothetical protein